MDEATDSLGGAELQGSLPRPLRLGRDKAKKNAPNSGRFSLTDERTVQVVYLGFCLRIFDNVSIIVQNKILVHHVLQQR